MQGKSGDRWQKFRGQAVKETASLYSQYSWCMSPVAPQVESRKEHNLEFCDWKSPWGKNISDQSDLVIQPKTKCCFKFGVILIFFHIFSLLSVQFGIEKHISKQRVNRLILLKCQSELSQGFQNLLPPATSQIPFPWLKIYWVWP